MKFLPVVALPTIYQKAWNSVHIDLVGPYYKSIIQQHPCGVIIKKYVSPTCLAMIDVVTGWFKNFEVLFLYLAEVAKWYNEYIDKFSARVCYLFSQIWLCRYQRPQEVLFENGSNFKRQFTPLLKYFSITLVCTSINNPPCGLQHDCCQGYWLQGLWLHIPLVGKTRISSVVNKIILSSYLRLHSWSGHFEIYILFNLVSIIDLHVITARK